MKKQLASLALAVIMLVPTLVQAHAGHKHKSMMGTVKSISASHIDLTMKNGKTMSVPVNKDTMFMAGDNMAAADDVKHGTRVVIVMGEDGKTAAHVKMAAQKK